jgi:hypothetical protein
MNRGWKFIMPFYSLQWWLRPLLASLLHPREPAKFHMILEESKHPTKASD